jgi:hypothetical protein
VGKIDGEALTNRSGVGGKSLKIKGNLTLKMRPRRRVKGW